MALPYVLRRGLFVCCSYRHGGGDLLRYLLLQCSSGFLCELRKKKREKDKDKGRFKLHHEARRVSAPTGTKEVCCKVQISTSLKPKRARAKLRRRVGEHVSKTTSNSYREPLCHVIAAKRGPTSYSITGCTYFSPPGAGFPFLYLDTVYMNYYDHEVQPNWKVLVY